MRLIGFTGTLSSSYYWLLLLPVISAGTSLGVLGTQIFIVLSCGAYLSFLGFIDWDRYVIEPQEKRELALRVIFLAVAGNLTNTLAEALRRQFAKTKAVAEQLAEANRNLQEAEEAVRRSDRLAALGQLAAGLAHELRNPLGTIRASAEMLNRSVAAENEVAREVAGFIAEEVDRTNSLVTRFLDFVRPARIAAGAGGPGASAGPFRSHGGAGSRRARGDHLQELLARHHAFPAGRGTDGAGLLQSAGQCRAGYGSRRCGHHQDAACRAATPRSR